MDQDVATPLKAWDSFYVIVGSAAGALTGLQFVVLTLIAEAGAARGRRESMSAFGSPNVVHFCAALLVASILSAPWNELLYAGIAVAGCGALGVVYSAVVLRRARRQSEYRAVFEDWLWHTILPLLAYSALFAAGAILGRSSAHALFVIGAALLLLVFIGIHNAWDTVTYLTVQGGIREQRAQERAEARSGAASAGPSGPAPSSASGVTSPGEPPALRTPGSGSGSGT